MVNIFHYFERRFNIVNTNHPPISLQAMNMMTLPNSPPDVGATLQRMRTQRGLTLEDLSRTAGVSKSMLSQIERDKANPTIAVAWRLANALGIGIEELLTGQPKETPAIQLIEPHETPTLPGSHAGYVLRILGPMELAGKVEWYELGLAPGGALVSSPHDPGTMEHLSVLQGTIALEVGEVSKKLKAGSTARYQADTGHAIRNTGKNEAKAMLVVIHR